MEQLTASIAVAVVLMVLVLRDVLIDHGRVVRAASTPRAGARRDEARDDEARDDEARRDEDLEVVQTGPPDKAAAV